jgi:hypothetical protein
MIRLFVIGRPAQARPGSPGFPDQDAASLPEIHSAEYEMDHKALAIPGANERACSSRRLWNVAHRQCRCAAMQR